MSEQLDMGAVLALMIEASELAAGMHGQVLEVDEELGKKRKADPVKAKASHDLLYLQQLLTLAAAEVGMRYHELKGRLDPRWLEPEDVELLDEPPVANEALKAAQKAARETIQDSLA